MSPNGTSCSPNAEPRPPKPTPSPVSRASTARRITSRASSPRQRKTSSRTSVSSGRLQRPVRRRHPPSAPAPGAAPGRHPHDRQHSLGVPGTPDRRLSPRPHRRRLRSRDGHRGDAHPGAHRAHARRSATSRVAWTRRQDRGHPPRQQQRDGAARSRGASRAELGLPADAKIVVVLRLHLAGQGRRASCSASSLWLQRQVSLRRSCWSPATPVSNIWTFYMKYLKARARLQGASCNAQLVLGQPTSAWSRWCPPSTRRPTSWRCPTARTTARSAASFTRPRAWGS